MRHRIELRDREMNFVNVLDDRAINLKWGFDPNGGCSDFSFKAASKYCTELDLGANFNVRIYLRNETTKNYDLVYQGRIENTSVSIDHPETIDVQGFGYQSALRDIVINQNFTSTEISVIVKSLLDNHIVPNTDITYSAADIDATSFTPDSVKFIYATAQEALDKLREIAGNVEMGVDKNRKFYFKTRSTVTGFRYPVGSNKLLEFKMGSSSREIINRVIVRGGTVSGSQFIYTKDYEKSQLKYKRRDAVIQNSAIVTSSVAEQFADAFQSEHNGTIDRGNAKILDNTIFESVLPVKLIEIVTREVTFNEKELDTFLFAGQSAFRIRKISYELTETMNLISSIELGANLPDIVEAIKQLDYNLQQVAQR